MNFIEKLKDFFPKPLICLYYLMGSVTFCYIYFHRVFSQVTFYEKNIGGIYHILAFEARVPNQFRLLIPYMFKIEKEILPFLGDRVVYFSIILVLMFFTLVIFYNILNEYFTSKRINSYLAFILFFPALWQFIIANMMFDFTDTANMFFIFLGYFLILKNRTILLIIVFMIGTLNHDSIGFLIPMYLLFNYKKIFTMKVILNTVLMTVIIISVRMILTEIFKDNPGLTWRPNVQNNLNAFSELPNHIIARNFILYFGGMHIFVLYFLISGRWKHFRTRYLYMSATLIPYVIIVFLIHTTQEARNYITALPFILIPFLLLLTTFKDSFLKPAPQVVSDPEFLNTKRD